MIRSRWVLVLFAAASGILVVASAVGLIAVRGDHPPVTRHAAGPERAVAQVPHSPGPSTVTSEPSLSPQPSPALTTNETLPAVSVFTGALAGFAVTSTVTAASGAQTFPPADAKILRTTDGGRTWTVAFEEQSAELSSITAVDGHVIAVGDMLSAQQGRSGPLLVTSADSGATWAKSIPGLPAAVTSSAPDRLAGPFGGLRLQFFSPQLGFAVLAPQTSSVSAEPLKTTDGGRTWSIITVGQGPNSIAFPTVTTWVIAGSSPGCEGRLWISHDAGDTWTAVAGTCEPFLLLDLAFPTSTTGYAVGGTDVDQVAFPDRAVLATTNGGATWSARWLNGSPYGNDGGQPFSSVAFVNTQVGYAVTNICKLGQNSPCHGPLWRTGDGGRSWTQLDQDVYEVQASTAGDVWVMSGQVAGLPQDVLHSSDSGTSFTPLSSLP